MIIVVMGVTGSGKTTVGGLLAARLAWLFADADDFHSSANKEKMHKGIPLTDADRLPWLAAMHEQIAKWIASKQNAVLACSALKQNYRRQLWDGPEVQFVYLKGSYDLIASRLRDRKGHFADLEEPCDAIVADITASPAEIVAVICKRLNLESRP